MNKLIKDGTAFSFRVGPIGAEGVVGNAVQVSMSRVLIDGDADFDKLINQICDLRMAVELVNGYEGKWQYADPFDRGKDKEEKDA